jgi:Uma2 family endonuclease
MAEVAEKRMTVAEFLTWDDGTDTRYELVDGRPAAMARVAPSHSVMVANLGAALHGNLKAPYYVGAISGVIAPECDDTFYVADPIVSGTPLHAGGVWTIPQPTVVIEVLSPTTAEHDRGGKLYDYRRIASVQEIALVSSEQRHVEIWRRRGAKWEVEDLIGDAALELETVGVAIPFAAVYADSGV